MTFIEVLVSVVLLGTVGLAVLAGLQMTLLGSAIERDHARAQQWLQSASELLTNEVPWASCLSPTQPAPPATPVTIPTANIIATYRTALAGDPTIVPPGWGVSQISVTNVRFAAVNGVYGTTCNEPGLNRQNIQIQVRDTEGDIVETVDIIKVP
jgi:Tfp pilus assembly protein PilV